MGAGVSCCGYTRGTPLKSCARKVDTPGKLVNISTAMKPSHAELEHERTLLSVTTMTTDRYSLQHRDTAMSNITTSKSSVESGIGTSVPTPKMDETAGLLENTLQQVGYIDDESFEISTEVKDKEQELKEIDEETLEDENDDEGQKTESTSKKIQRLCEELENLNIKSKSMLIKEESIQELPQTPVFKDETGHLAVPGLTADDMSPYSSSQPIVFQFERSRMLSKDGKSISIDGANSSMLHDDSPFHKVLYSPQSSPSLNNRAYFRTIECTEALSLDLGYGYRILNQYQLKEQLGKGSFGIVKLAYNTADNNHYAMKIMSKRKLAKKAGFTNRRLQKGPKDDPLKKVYREIAILKKLIHPNVIRLYEVVDDPSEDNLYLVFEYIENREVMEIPTNKPLNEEKARCYFRDILQGLEYLHYQKIVHRDIKPSNLLLTKDDHIKIADFGVSLQFEGEDAVLSDTSGTPAFLPPESLQGNKKSHKGKAMDIWALGITLYCFVYGKTPFNAEGEAGLIALHESIINNDISFPIEPVISNDLRILITKLLDKDPVTRITIPELKVDPWVTTDGQLPRQQENCIMITVTDDDIQKVVTHIPKIATLILVKGILRRKSFCNPFNCEWEYRSMSRESATDSADSHKLSRQSTENSIDLVAPTTALISERGQLTRKQWTKSKGNVSVTQSAEERTSSEK